jgi:hypothetical protein
VAYERIRKYLPLSVFQFNHTSTIPTFAKLHRRIEQANSNSSQVFQYIKEIEADVSEIARAPPVVLRTHFMVSHSGSKTSSEN